jgi:cytoskeleton protein RodZ
VADCKSLRTRRSVPPPAADVVRPAPLDVFTPVGEQLRCERERRGITLAAVAEVTKIRRTYLQAVERNDWDALPAAVFARGYLRAYAEHLGMDAEHLLRVHERERRLRRSDPAAAARETSDGQGWPEPIAETDLRNTGLRKGSWIVGGILVACIAIAAAVYWTQY